MPVARRLNVSAAVLLTTLCAARPGHATPPATSEVVAAEGERAAGPVRAVNDTSTPADTKDADTTGANTTDSDTTGAYEIVNDTRVIEQHEEHQQHAYSLDGIGVLPLVQKITFVVVLIWILGLNFEMVEMKRNKNIG